MAAEYKGIAKGLGQLGIIDGDLASSAFRQVKLSHIDTEFWATPA